MSRQQEAVNSQHLCLVELEATTDYVHDTNQLTDSGSHDHITLKNSIKNFFFPSISLLVTEDSAIQAATEVFIILSYISKQGRIISFP